MFVGADHIGLLLHTEVRRLSRGQVLNRVYELRRETVTFLNKQNHASLTEKFSQEKFIANATDIYNLLNSLNQSMQELGLLLLITLPKLPLTIKKLILWQTCVDRDEFSMFPELEKYCRKKNKCKRHDNRTPR